jgi:hypothetical protein
MARRLQPITAVAGRTFMILRSAIYIVRRERIHLRRGDERLEYV